MIINSDATQFTVGGNVKKKTEVVYSNSRNTSYEPLKVLPDQREGLTAYSIKYYAIISAGGYVANPIFIIADEHMNEDDIAIYEIAPMGLSTNPHCKGYLVFCKTRRLNKEIYEWMAEEVMIIFIKEIKTSQELPEDSLVYTNIDGEDLQLKTLIDLRIQAILKDNNIVTGKPPGSTSSITQPCDARSFFRATKTALRRMLANENFHNHDLEEALKTAFNLHDSRNGNFKFKA